MRSILLLLASFSLPAQQPNTVSTAVSVTQPAAVGTAVFQLQFVDTNLNSTVDTAIGVLGGAGASAVTLRDISVSLNQGFVLTQYDFAVNVPAAEFAAARDKLIAVSRALANSNTQAVAWSASYTALDDDAKALEQALPGLLEKAKTQAGVLATAMGAKLGKVSSITTTAVVKAGLTATVSATVTYLVE